jgi:hypothetical protein
VKGQRVAGSLRHRPKGEQRFAGASAEALWQKPIMRRSIGCGKILGWDLGSAVK